TRAANNGEQEPKTMMTRRKSTVLLGALALGWGALALVGRGGGEKGGGSTARASAAAPAAGDNAPSAAPAAPAGAAGPTGTGAVGGAGRHGRAALDIQPVSMWH